MLRLRRLLPLGFAVLALVVPSSAPAQEPTWYSLPYILGPNPPSVGSALSGENGGLWCDPACTSQVYQWFHCTANSNESNCVAVTPVQGSKYYTVQAGDVGWSLVVQVIATSYDCNEANTECRFVTKTKNSLPTAPVQGSSTGGGGAPSPPPPPPEPIVVSPNTLFPSTPGLFYSQSLRASGGTAPYTYALTSGLLPHGLTLSSTGVLSGITDSGVGLFPFVVTVRDKAGKTLAKSLNLVVASPMIVATPLGLPTALASRFYAVTLGASGGIAPHSFTLADGALPPGVSLGMDGQLSGIPPLAGTWLFTVQMLDSRGSTGTQSYRFVVDRQPTVVKKKPARKPAKKRPKKR